jgi:SAM-dependent methyltransferase
MAPELKSQVREFWDRASCGEMYATGESEIAAYEAQRNARYELEPYLPEFARFADGAGRDVLEIGVGMGADHVEWARSGPKTLTGVDLTPRAVEHTRRRMALLGLESNVRVDDAENLSFADNSFDLVYSWGVLHHSPNTAQAIEEVRRVLRPGGTARVMIYHKYSIVGYMLWARYGLARGRPFRSLDDIYAHHLESPGTKAYTVSETKRMFAGFSSSNVRSHLAFGDLLQGQVGQRHQSALLSVAKAVWPRWFIKRFLGRHGVMVLIDAVK